MKIFIISPTLPPKICGVGDYSYQLGKALRNKGIEVEYFTSQKDFTDEYKKTHYLKNWGIEAICQIKKQCMLSSKPPIIFFNWLPFLFHKRGVPLFLCLAYLFLLKKQTSLLMIHEPYIPWKFGKHSTLWFPFAITQRFCLFLLCLGSTKTYTASEVFIKKIPKYISSGSISHLPIGSNIPLLPTTDKPKHQNITIGLFRPSSGALPMSFFIKAYLNLIKFYPQTTLRILGSLKNGDLEQLHENTIMYESKGQLSLDKLSQEISTCTIIWSFFTDGNSLRRTTLSAFFEHKKAIIGNIGFLTDSLLKVEQPMIFATLDAEELAHKTKILIESADKKIKYQNAAAEFYQKNLSWNEISKRVIADALHLS